MAIGEDMCALKVQLERDEEVVFESDRAVLTSRRLLANLDKKNRELVTDDVPLQNIVDFKKGAGGRESRLDLGLKALGIGLVLVILQVLLPLILPAIMPRILEMLLFLAGSLAIVVALYLLMDSFLRVKPYTSVVFSIMGSRDVPVYFEGRDNPDADEITRHYVRVKRDLSIN